MRSPWGIALPLPAPLPPASCCLFWAEQMGRAVRQPRLDPFAQTPGVQIVPRARRALTHPDVQGCVIFSTPSSAAEAVGDFKEKVHRIVIIVP